MIRPSAILQNLVHEMIRDYEERNGTTLSGRFVEVFGMEDGNRIERLQDGTWFPPDPEVLTQLALRLGAESSLAAAALRAFTWQVRAPSQEAGAVLNDRLMLRLENLERYLRKIGKLDDFRAWLKAGAPD